MEAGIEERRVAIEVIATLVHVKNTMAELILKPAGVPPDIYRPLLCRRDEATGHLLSKRQIAPLILDAIEARPDQTGVIRRIIEIAAGWTSFHLAHDEFLARATVQKAREVMGTIELMEAWEAKQREISGQEELARVEHDQAEAVRRQSELLLMMFDELAVSTDEQRRGYLLQDLLNRLFDLHGIPVVSSFTRNEGAEQIDGAFKIEGWHYIVECRWRKKLSDIRELDGLFAQVGRSGKQTMGLFLSINGWSDNVCPLLKQNPSKSILLMDGYDLRAILAQQVELRGFFLAKVAKLNLEAEPFYGVSQHLNRQEGRRRT